MTPQIIIVLSILGVAVALFISERIRVDIVALLVLVSLTLTRIITPAEALSGFSNPAVVTVWAVFVLSAGLARTGVANKIGERLLKFVGKSETKLLLWIMLVVGILSGFMNNIGVASLFLPVVITIARRIRVSPSKLLIPMAFASLMGGMITLIGSPSNIIISESLRDAGLDAFDMFDYAPMGLAILFAGIAYMLIFGRRLLPSRDITQEYSSSKQFDYPDIYRLDERMFVINLPADSPLAEKSLTESRLGAALGLNIFAILRGNRTILAPKPQDKLKGNDRLLVEGSKDLLSSVLGQQHLALDEERFYVESLVSPDVDLVELEIILKSSLDGETLLSTDFRNSYGLVVLAIRRDDQVMRTHLEEYKLQTGDFLLAQGNRQQISSLDQVADVFTTRPAVPDVYNLEENLMVVSLLPKSSLIGKSLIEGRLGEVFGLGVMGIIRDGDLQLMPDPSETLKISDVLLVKGRREELSTIEGLQNLHLDSDISLGDQLESDRVGLVEAVLSPHSILNGKTLRELSFRSRYGLNVLAIWREGKVFRSKLRDMALRFGDALLLYGPREKACILGEEADFIVLTADIDDTPRENKAPLAIGIMALVLIPVILGWVHIAIAAIAGIVLMVLTESLTMEEAYRSIQWKAIFLIAGMLPLGIAIEKTGAALLIAEGMVDLVGGFNPLVVLASLFSLAAIASQVMPNPAVVVLLAPIALNIAADMSISPYPLMMAVAISASAVFMSPVGHPSNVIIMGPGGYRFKDYIKVGFPLTLLVLVVVLLLLPLIWPF